MQDDTLSPALIGQVVYPNLAAMDRYQPGIAAIIEGGASASEGIEQVEL